MYVRNAHGDYKMPVPTFSGEKCSVKGCQEIGTDRAHIRKCSSTCGVFSVICEAETLNYYKIMRG